MKDENFSKKQIICPTGMRISDYIAKIGLKVPFPCGGQGTCGHCKIKVYAGNLPVTDTDKAFLSRHELDNNIRLACRALPDRPVRIGFVNATEEEMQVEGVTEDKKPSEKPDFSHDFGIAIDIGTTTIAASLVDIQNGNIIDSITAVNSQRPLGADVISRIRAATSGNAGLLKRLIEKDLISVGEKFFIRQPEAYVKVRRIAIACNTVMSHLLLGYPCEGLASSPFQPYSVAEVKLSPTELFSENDPSRFFSESCVFDVLPGIGAFAGSDIAAGLMKYGFANENADMAFIDLGTNSEIALLHDKTIYITAAAAGPAFEGGHISCGIPGIPGAIKEVAIEDNKCFVKTIGDKLPEGLCGTGIVSAVSSFLQNGILDDTGKFNETYFLSGFTFYKGVTLTQDDIREFQLAKGAVRAGLETLMKKAGVNELNRLFIAGGFGTNLNVKDATETGLIPPAAAGKCQAVGNSSLEGAVMYLTDKDAFRKINRIIDMAEEINLGDDEDFKKFYIKSMNF